MLWLLLSGEVPFVELCHQSFPPPRLPALLVARAFAVLFPLVVEFGRLGFGWTVTRLRSRHGVVLCGVVWCGVVWCGCVVLCYVVLCCGVTFLCFVLICCFVRRFILLLLFCFLQRDSHVLQNVRREVALMKKLVHPNVVRLLEVIDDPQNDLLFMVSETGHDADRKAVGVEIAIVGVGVFCLHVRPVLWAERLKLYRDVQVPFHRFPIYLGVLYTE